MKKSMIAAGLTLAVLLMGDINDGESEWMDPHPII